MSAQKRSTWVTIISGRSTFHQELTVLPDSHSILITTQLPGGVCSASSAREITYGKAKAGEEHHAEAAEEREGGEFRIADCGFGESEILTSFTIQRLPFTVLWAPTSHEPLTTSHWFGVGVPPIRNPKF
jgi:hypothetical protein